MVWLYSSLNLGTRWGWWSTPRPSRFTPEKEIRYQMYRRVVRPPGPVWRAAKNLAANGIQFPDRPGRSESLYRLFYPGPQWLVNIQNNWFITLYQIHFVSVLIRQQSWRLTRYPQFCHIRHHFDVLEVITTFQDSIATFSVRIWANKVAET